MARKQLSSIKPALDELLPTPALREAYEEASAALEAGRLVRTVRTEAGLSQKMLAARLSITQARVSAIESGEGRDGPSYGLLRRIAAACGTPLAAFFARVVSLGAASPASAPYANVIEEDVGLAGVSAKAVHGSARVHASSSKGNKHKQPATPEVTSSGRHR